MVQVVFYSKHENFISVGLLEIKNSPKTHKNMKKITILVPVCNEAEGLPKLKAAIDEVIAGLPQYEWEMLFVNDGSLDRSLEVMGEMRENDERVSYLDLSRNFGKENAMLAGMDFAKGDAVIIMDADMQDPPSLIPKMVKYWEEGYEDVYAKRGSRGKESFLRAAFTRAFYRILQKSTRFEMLENVGDFRLLDRCCLNALKRMRETERYTKGMYCWIGFHKKEIVFDRGDRVEGASNWKMSGLFNLAIDGITSFTTVPLRIASVLGVFVSSDAIIYMFWILIKTLIWGDPVAGFPTLMVVILFLGGCQLLALGIIGEYLGRVFNESKNRPAYIAREYNGEKL